MAVQILWKFAIAVAPALVRTANTADGAGAPGPADIPRLLWDRLSDPDEADADLEDALSAGTGSMWNVTTFSAPFSLRKAQVRWGRNSSAAAGTDDAVTTHHFIKLASGAPVAAWVSADFQAVESALETFWVAIKSNWSNKYSYKQVRWYTVDPAIALSGPPVRVIDPAITGASSAVPHAPQVALSVTERTTDPKAWGRFYLPPPVANLTTTEDQGRGNDSFVAGVAAAAETMYESCVTAGVPGVVYSSAKPARETKGGTPLPAQVARALTVTTVQVDDLFDVIRSRRYNEPLLRAQQDIAGA